MAWWTRARLCRAAAIVSGPGGYGLWAWRGWFWGAETHLAVWFPKSAFLHEHLNTYAPRGESRGASSAAAIVTMVDLRRGVQNDGPAAVRLLPASAFVPDRHGLTAVIVLPHARHL